MGPIEPTRSGKIVVIHQGALGDFLLALPVLEGLHRSYPMMRMDIWAKAEHVALLAEKSYVGKARPPDDSELTPFFQDKLWLEAKAPRFLDGSAAILVFGQKGGRELARRLNHRMPCPVYWIQSFPGPDSHEHVHHFLLEQLRHLGWPIPECLPELRPSPQEVSSVRTYLKSKNRIPPGKPILVHPGSGGLRKIWPLKNCWALLRFLCERHCGSVYLSLGPADERLRSFAGEAEKLGAVTLEGFSLPRLAAFLAECRLFIGSDSGVSHLAAAVGIPTVVIFGPTDPAIWAPRGPHVQVLEDKWDEAEVTGEWSPECLEVPRNPRLLELIGTPPPLFRGGPEDTILTL